MRVVRAATWLRTTAGEEEMNGRAFRSPTPNPSKPSSSARSALSRTSRNRSWVDFWPPVTGSAEWTISVMVYSVSRRTREIGVRLALGADRRDIAFMVLAGAAKLILIRSGGRPARGLFPRQPRGAAPGPGLRPSDPVSFL